MKVGVLCIKKEGVHFDTPPSLFVVDRIGSGMLSEWLFPWTNEVNKTGIPFKKW